MDKSVGVILSGCGAFDGTEVQEAVLTQLFLNQAGADIVFAAPNINQSHVLHHMTLQETDESRNVMNESARITRGNMIDLQDLSIEKIDALIISGGFGTIKNLSNFAMIGPEATVHWKIQRLLDQMLNACKPIGALGMASIVVTAALSAHRPEVTIGTASSTATAIETMGGHHKPCDATDIVVDAKNKIVTTPAYMQTAEIKEIAIGIKKLVKKVLALTD